MRILVISPTQSGIGGVAQYVHSLTNYLRKHNHTVDIISSENTPIIPIKGLKNPSFAITSYFKTKFAKNYDIVHAQHPIALPAMRNVNGKKLVSLWGMLGDQVELLHGRTLGILSTKFEKHGLGWADMITIPSKEMYDFYTKRGYEVEFLTNAVDLSSLSKNKERLYKKQITYAGRLSEEKGILDVLEMAKKLPKDINLLILGSGPEEPKTKDAAAKLPNVHYMGYQPKDKVVALIRGSDIVVQPSLMEGSLSSTLIESMACGVPTISTTAGTNKETIEHLKTSFVVNSQSPDEILAGIDYLFSNESGRAKIIENGHVLAKKFDWEVVGKRHLELYEKMLNSSK